MTNVMSIAASGMQSALRAFGTSAANVTAAAPPASASSTATVAGVLNAPPASAGDLAGAVVGSLQAANAFRANLAVFQTAEQMSKTLLDTLT